MISGSSCHLYPPFTILILLPLPPLLPALSQFEPALLILYLYTTTFPFLRMTLLKYDMGQQQLPLLSGSVPLFFCRRLLFFSMPFHGLELSLTTLTYGINCLPETGLFVDSLYQKLLILTNICGRREAVAQWCDGSTGPDPGPRRSAGCQGYRAMVGCHGRPLPRIPNEQSAVTT